MFEDIFLTLSKDTSDLKVTFINKMFNNQTLPQTKIIFYTVCARCHDSYPSYK